MRYLLIFIILAILGSCKPTQYVTERTHSDTTIIKETERIVTIPGQTIQSPIINIDSLIGQIRAGIKPEVINRNLYTEDPETKLRVGLLIDELGNLTALCETQDQMIKVMDKEIKRLESQSIKVVEKPTFWDKFWYGILGAAIGIVFTQLVTVFLRR